VTTTPVHAYADAAASASVREVDGRMVMWFRIAGGNHHGAIGVQGGATVERAVRLAGELQIPLVGELDTSGAELREHVASLHAWGRLAREVARISGTVPTLLAVTGACVSGPALALGLFDVIVMTEDAFAYVSGPEMVTEFTGVHVTRDELGSAGIHARRSGVATLVVADARAAEQALRDCATSSRTSPTIISMIRRATTSTRRPTVPASGPRPRSPTGRPRPTTSAASSPTCATAARSSNCGPSTRRTS
jgi:acetyl-CoA carboxylase carboxyltransferase component